MRRTSGLRRAALVLPPIADIQPALTYGDPMDRATPNLPSRDFDVTSAFYANFGFEEGWRDDGWMILKRGNSTLEFFPHRDLKPSDSWFSCCLRLDDLAAFYSACLEVGVPEQCCGHPRVQPPRLEENGLTIAALIDPDGTLLPLYKTDLSSALQPLRTFGPGPA
jgi:hypothetical protein